MIIVTGGAGFIGSNIVKALNQQSGADVLVVDNLANTAKVANLSDCTLADYRDKQDFYQSIVQRDPIAGLDAILHQGACSDTMVADGRYVMHNNFQYSKALLDYCDHYKIPLLYASSASVYGAGEHFQEIAENERPLNAYAYSKLAFDQHLRFRQASLKIPVVGFRYFNVYGPREQHKGRMASVAYHFFNQFKQQGKVKLFAGTDGYNDGEQRRDFVSIEDVVSVNMFFLNKANRSGIFNLGTGKSQTFNEVAVAVVNYFLQKRGDEALDLSQMIETGLIEYIAFPDSLKGKYQSFTQADIRFLTDSGYDKPFLSVEQGVSRYMQQLDKAE